MTATFTAQPRRHGLKEPRRSPRELPVLFHLVDVSRPQGYGAASATEGPRAAAEAEPTSPPETQPPQIQEASQPAPLGSVAEAFDLATAASLAETGGLEISAGGESSWPTAETPGRPAAEAPDQLKSALRAAAGAKVHEPVTPRQRAEDRQRQRQPASAQGWFSTHGKFIAIGFVLALVATIYAARTRQAAAPRPHTTRPPAKTAERTPAQLASEIGPSAGGSTVAIKGISPLAEGAGRSQALLHPPTIPQLAQQPAKVPEAATAAAEKAHSTSDEGLFPWARQPTEERVAARTTLQADVPAAANSTSPPVGPLPPAQPSPATAAVQQQYPSTGSPVGYQPAPAPAYSTPASSTPAYSAPASSTTPPNAAAPGYSAAPAYPATPTYPTTNSASGYRYERTGSGFH